MIVKCLIIGCQLRGPGFIQHGDLHELGDCYIFNACGEPKEDWSADELEVNALIISDVCQHGSYFERRNVYIVTKAASALTSAAEARIARDR